MVEFRNVCVKFGEKTVLDGFNFSVPEGAHVALMGPSGVGKTTVLRLIAGLQKPDSGTVEVRTARTSVLFQQPRLLPWLSAEENVNCVLSDHRSTLSQAREWLRLLGMAGEEEHFPAELSGGMQQRVALARALAFGGELVLLDEPFQGLDEKTRAEAIEVCRAQLANKTTVLVTHARQEAEALADVIYTFGPDGLYREELK